MSLSRRNDGCPQCRNRRLRCDKTEPECLKCLKKGLRCSGQGFECRFSTHMSKLSDSSNSHDSPTTLVSGTTTSPVRKPRSVPRTPVRRPPERLRKTSSRVSQVWAVTAEEALAGSEAKTGSLSSGLEMDLYDVEMDVQSPAARYTALTSYACIPPVFQVDAHVPLDLILCPPLEPMGAQQTFLFNHFSKHIASKMVVYDRGSNGYRDIILPIAYQDETVGKAICAVSAFHLGMIGSQNGLRTAEAAQQHVLTKLLRDTAELKPQRVFTLTTWAAIVVLLVGDTITGSTNYVFLLEMLKHLVASATVDTSMPVEARMFLLQQTKMFEFFSSVLTNERTGLEVLTGPLDEYLGWAMYSEPQVSDVYYTNMQVIRSATLAACHMCVRRMRNSCSYECPNQELDSLREAIVSLDSSIDGAHALVWTCFVAAAESVQPEHREFFSERLASLYGCTRFGTIPQALEMLETIWNKQGKQKWTEFVTLERPILVM